MFGQNPIRSAVTDPRTLAVESVFYTIQGEGPYAGMPALFIRLAGCNLACHFCDTQFEKMAESALPVGNHLADILARFTRKQREFVVLTGGEPLRQDAAVLVDALLNTGTALVQIETAGTLAPSDAMLRRIEQQSVVLVCSPKTPKVHPAMNQYCNHWKYIIRAGEISSTDGLPNRGTQRGTMNTEQILYRAPKGLNVIWVSPCDDYDVEKNAANLEAVKQVALVHGYRISLQMHKILNVE